MTIALASSALADLVTPDRPLPEVTGRAAHVP